MVHFAIDPNVLTALVGLALLALSGMFLLGAFMQDKFNKNNSTAWAWLALPVLLMAALGAILLIGGVGIVLSDGVSVS